MGPNQGGRMTTAGHSSCFPVFFFQAEDGIRDRNVTGVQTCALPILTPFIASASYLTSSNLSGPTSNGSALKSRRKNPNLLYQSLSWPLATNACSNTRRSDRKSVV